MTARKHMRSGIMALAILAAAAFFTPGCSPQSIQSIKDAIASATQKRSTVAQIMQDANANAVEARKQAAALPPGPAHDQLMSDANQFQAMADSQNKVVQKLNSDLVDLNKRLANANNGPDVLAALSTTVGTSGIPYGSLIGAVLATAAGVWGGLQKKQATASKATANSTMAAATSIIRSVDKISLTDDQRKILTAQQTEAAKALVDRVQGKAT